MHPADVLPSSIAEMDFDLAEPVRQALHAAVERGDLGYADGFADLAIAYADFAEGAWHWRPDPALVAPVTDVGVGAVELLRAVGARRAVISTPVYPPFLDWVPEAGARLIDVPLREGRLDPEALERAFRGGGAYLLCNPQNPTGTVHTATELAAVVAAAQRHGVVIISDEIHAPLALPGARYTPLLAVPGAEDVAVVLASASKAWNLAGLKCALIVSGGPATAPLLRRLPPDSRWRVGWLGVVAATAAFRHGEPWRSRLLHTLDDRRDYVTGLVRERLPELTFVPPAATYLGWLSSGPAATGTELADAVLTHGRVAVEAGENFGAGGAGHIRVNFATSRLLLDRIVQGIRTGLDSLG